MSYQPKPHLSAAVQHARVVVSMTGLVLGICLFLQVVVWAAVHYTDVRTTDLGDANRGNQTSLNVVNEAPKPVIRVAPGSTNPKASSSTAEDQAASLSPQEAGALLDDILTNKPGARVDESSSVDANQVRSAADIVLGRFSSLVQTIGIIAAIAFALTIYQATVIAGGAALPGVEKAVTASTWGLAVSMLCLPLASLFPTAPYGGVFLSYTQLIDASAAFRAGALGAPTALGFYGVHVALPFIILGAVFMTVLRFRAGVEAGVIVTSVSQLDEKLEQEIRGMKLGQLSAPRSVGALNTAIGDDGRDPVQPMRIPAEEEFSATGTDSSTPRPRRLI